jgi:hypothetical protein
MQSNLQNNSASILALGLDHTVSCKSKTVCRINLEGHIQHIQKKFFVT